MLTKLLMRPLLDLFLLFSDHFYYLVDNSFKVSCITPHNSSFRKALASYVSISKLFSPPQFCKEKLFFTCKLIIRLLWLFFFL